MREFQNKSVMITGSCGTVGSELLKQLSGAKTKRIVCIDNNETDLFFQSQAYRSSHDVVFHLADIRDKHDIAKRMKGIDVVLHSAALKHVGICEDSPGQAISTNVHGTQNIIDAAIENNVERVLFTSSDKAVNPTNVMGTTKLLGERLMTAAASLAEANNSRTIFASTRFGNVLGSRGSVVPIFKKQIEAGTSVTVTDKNMSRFIMTLEEAVSLVLQSVHIATGGEVFVTKMPVAMIDDIADVMLKTLNAKSEPRKIYIGAKPAEKMYEELMNDEEVRRSYQYGNFFVVISAFSDINDARYAYIDASKKLDKPYNSANEIPLEQNKILDLLQTTKLL